MKYMTIAKALKLVKAKIEPPISLDVGTNVSKTDGSWSLTSLKSTCIYIVRIPRA